MLDAQLITLLLIIVGAVNAANRHNRNESKNDPRSNGDLALWIDEKQVKMFSGNFYSTTIS